MWGKILEFIDLSPLEYLIIFVVLLIYTVCSIIVGYDSDNKMNK